eukprot:TRINITY_DN1746_c0_g1_i1.p1 TRINITY_DN1746_c0_g1~~TRINITY_DN1746_c0_g1_i1.p1  ORF type:complete len:904 (-),score=103.18 TRINITY_DN1746_c0_g1_i1:2758-5469(-)
MQKQANFWKDWKKYVYIRKARRVALKKRANTLMLQGLANWCLCVQKQKFYREILGTKRKELAFKTKRKYFSEWVRKYNAEETIREVLEHYQKIRARRIFAAFCHTLSTISGRKNTCAYIQASRAKFYKQLVIQALQEYAVNSKKKAENYELAQTHLSAILLSKALKAFYKLIHPQQPAEFLIKKKVRALHKRSSKDHIFQVWKSKAQKGMQKAKAVVLFSKGLRKIFTSIWLAKYRKEIQFFETLDQHIIAGWELTRVQVWFNFAYFLQQRLRHGVNKMLGASLAKKRMQRANETAKEYNLAKRKTLALNGWKLFLLREYQNKAKILKLRAFTNKRLLTRAFAAWNMVHKMELIKQQMKELARGFQIRHSCFPLWVLWKEKTVQKLEKREKKIRAENNYVEGLLVKAFVALKNEANNKKLKRQNERKAEYLASILLLKKCIKSLKTHAREEAETRLRNEAFAKVLSKYIRKNEQQIYIEVLLRWVSCVESQRSMEASAKGLAKMLQKKVLATHLAKLRKYAKKKSEQIVKFRKLSKSHQTRISKSVIKAWLKHAHKCKALKAITQKYKSAKNRKELQKIISKWRETRLILHSLNTAAEEVKEVANYRVIQNYWNNWKEQYITSVEDRERNFGADQHYAETLLVKAFVALKSHYKHHQLNREKVRKAKSFYGLVLAKKSIASLQEYCVTQKARAVHRFELSRRISQIDQYNLKETAFRALYGWYVYKKRLLAGQNVLQIKQRSHIRRRFLRKWWSVARAVIYQQEAVDCENARAVYERGLLTKVFKELKEMAKVGVRQGKRERMHAVFTAWKMLTKEQNMLRKYLKQCNIDEKYALTPGISYRFEAPKLHHAIGVSIISPESSEGTSSNRLGSEAVISAMRSENAKEESKTEDQKQFLLINSFI